MKKLNSFDKNYLNIVKYKWYQQWWFIIIVILTIPTNYGFSVMLAGFLIYSRIRSRKNITNTMNEK